jgi:hypothetical protein
MRVLVCGGRDYADYVNVVKMLSALETMRGPFTTIIHGCARGADTLADRYARANDIVVAKFPADWERYGSAAGPIRNRQMLDEGKPDLVVAFPGGRGTANMVQQARRVGVEVYKG